MSIHVWLDEMFESNRKWAERDEGIGRFLTTELLKPPPFLRGSRSLVAKVPNTPRSIGDIFQVEWNIQAFVSFSLPFPPTLLSLSSIIPPYLFVSSRRYYCFFHTIYTFSYIRVRYFSSSFLPNTCTLDPRRENCSFEYADGFPLRRHTHSLSLSLSVSRGSIDKPSPPDSIIFSLFYFIFFFTSDPSDSTRRRSGEIPEEFSLPHFLPARAFSRQESSSPALIRLVDSSYFRILSALLHLVRLENIVARKRRLVPSSFSKPAYTEPSGNSFTGREDPASIMTLNISNTRSTRKMFPSRSYVVYIVCITDYVGGGIRR